MSHVSLGLHFCHDQLHEISINEDANCCGDVDVDGCSDNEDHPEAEDCCEDLEINYEYDQVYKAQNDIVHFKAPLAKQISIAPILEEVQLLTPFTESLFTANGPPLYLSLCSLVLYG